MKIFISWLIANIWEVVTVIAVIAFEVWLLVLTGRLADNKAMIAILGPVLLICARAVFGGTPAKNITTNIVNAVVLLILVFVAWEMANSPTAKDSMATAAAAIIAANICGLCAAVVASVFTYCNFQMVLSHRMIYRNSATSLFSVQIAYILDRFIAVWGSVAYTVTLVSIA